MEPLDGNAVAGTLFDVFGTEMTAAIGICANCGTRSHLAESMVYLRGPGVVLRCRNCENVLMILVQIRGVTCVDAMGLSDL